MSRFGGLPLDSQSTTSRFGGVAIDEQVENDPVGPIEDTAKSIGSNLVGGAIDTAMVLPNLVNAAAAGPQLLGRGIADSISPLLGVTPQPRGDLWQPFFGSHDAERTIGTDYQPETTAGKVAALPSRIVGGIVGAKGIDTQRANVGRLLSSDAGKAPAKATAKTADDIKTLAREQYALRDADGAVLQPSVSDKFSKGLDKLSRQTVIGRELAGDSVFTDTVNRLKMAVKGKRITLKAADEIDDFLSDRISETYIANPAQSQKLQEIKSLFRKSIDPDSLSKADVVGGTAGLQSWRAGDKLWQAQSKLREIDKIVTRANMTENPATAMKTGFRNLYMNAKKTRGYSKEEMKLLETAAESGVASDILGALGSRLGQIISLGSGAGLGQTAALAASSMAARGGKSALQAGRASKLSSTIAKGAMPSRSAAMPRNINEVGKYSSVMTPGAVAPSLSLDELRQLPPEEALRLLYGANPQ